jgi:hypothetical protein
MILTKMLCGFGAGILTLFVLGVITFVQVFVKNPDRTKAVGLSLVCLPAQSPLGWCFALAAFAVTYSLV